MFFKKISAYLSLIISVTIAFFIILGNVSLEAQSSGKADNKTAEGEKKVSTDDNKNKQS